MTDCSFFKSLQTKYYAPVPFDVSPKELEEAIHAFYVFLKEPDAIKTAMNFKMPPEQRRGEVGFYHRDPTEDIYRDNKDFFHFHPLIFDRYGSFIENHPRVADFMHKALPIWEQTRNTARKVFTKFELLFPGTMNKVFQGDHARIFLRFLSYNWNACGKYLAKPHFDAGSFTLALAESGPGLRIGSGPDNLALISHHPGQAIFFLSSVFNKVIDTSDYQPGWHDVIQVDETIIGKPFARWSIVAFIEVPGVAQLSREETHKFYEEAGGLPHKSNETF